MNRLHGAGAGTINRPEVQLAVDRLYSIFICVVVAGIQPSVARAFFKQRNARECHRRRFRLQCPLSACWHSQFQACTVPFRLAASVFGLAASLFRLAASVFRLAASIFRLAESSLQFAGDEGRGFNGRDDKTLSQITTSSRREMDKCVSRKWARCQSKEWGRGRSRVEHVVWST